MLLASILRLSWITDSGDGHPEFDLRAEARPALDFVPAAGHQGALLEGQEAQMSRQVVSLRDLEPLAVVGHQSMEARIARGQAHLDTRRLGVLFDIGDGLGNLAEDG